MRSKIVSFALFLLAQALCAQSADYEAYEKKEFIKGKDTLRYRILWPLGFSKEKEYPVVLFLHGRGESGADNETQLVHGSKLFLEEENRENHPAIVIFPQCPKDDYWAKIKRNNDKKGKERFTFVKGGKPNPALGLVIQLMEKTVAEPYTKDNQLYVGGLSMGGMGTFEILSRKPGMFAAAFAICGGGHPETATLYAKKTAVWVFHGAKDDVVAPYFSKQMVKALLEADGDVQLSIYENANHNSWDPAFAEPRLLPWLFSHKKNKE